MVFDDTYPFFDDSSFFKLGNWEAFYPEASEPIPIYAPLARGNSIALSYLVDADHDEYKVSRRSHTDVLLFVNESQIVWYSKRQNTVESSLFCDNNAVIINNTTSESNLNPKHILIDYHRYREAQAAGIVQIK